MGNRDDRLGLTAEAQHGVVSRDDLTASGVDLKGLQARLANGALQALGRNAFRHRGVPVTQQVRAISAVINTPGPSYLSHTSAAWLWQIPGFDLSPIHVARRYRGTRRPGDADHIHNLRGVPDSHVGELLGIPVASPTLTMFQLAAVCHPMRAERAVDNAIKMGLTDPVRLRVLLGQLAARGRNGIRAMRRILAARPPDYRPPDSGLESRFQEIATNIGLEVERQINVGGDAFVTRVDFRDAKQPDVVYRIQSERWHTAVSHARDDATQSSILADSGFTVVDIWDVDIWRDRAKVENQLRATRA